MLVLTLRTDKPQAEIGLYENEKRILYKKWHAHRELAETLHTQIAKNLHSLNTDWPDIQGVVVYKGPGSFTGLRIGLSVANALAYAQNIPIIGTSGNGWVEKGIVKLGQNKDDVVALPDYGAPVNITRPKK